MGVKPLAEILARNRIPRPDGRPLHAYRLTEEERAALAQLLPVRIAVGERLGSTAQGFVLWAAEQIRRDWPGGHLTWEFVYQGLGLAPPDYAFTRWLVEAGLAAWGRPLRRGEAGHREFLFSLLAEGGLPDAALTEATRYGRVLRGLIAELEAEGALAAAAADRAALRAVQGLPQLMRDGDQARLMAELALGLIALRAALPADLPREAATGWLDAQQPGWRESLPLALSDRALEAIVRPALAAERGRPDRAAAPLRRMLLSDGAGGWVGAAEIVEGAFLPAALMPQAAGKTLRLLAEGGASFLARPEGAGGWRLMLAGGAARQARAPWAAVLVSAHDDGRHLGELMLDPGLPAPEEAPGLWEPADRGDAAPDVLIPLPGRARTRAGRLFLLLPEGVAPQPGAGVTIGAAAPAPGGRLWPLAGRGTVAFGDQTIAIETGAEAGAEPARLMTFGRLLPGLACADGSRPFLGAPELWAAEGEGPLRRLPDEALRRRALPRLLGGKVAEWVEGGAVLARLRLIVLPAALRLALTETGPGQLRLRAEGLGPGWHLALGAGAARAQAVADAEGRAELTLAAEGAPGLVTLRLSDPAGGAALELSGLWPARAPRLIDPAGRVLVREQQVALARLEGWRGHLPAGRGAVLMRLAGQGAQVGLPVAGEVRLAAHAGAAAQALALAGADGRVNLRVAAAGTETPRLSVGRYDWESEEAGPFRHLGAGRTRLAAVLLEDPARSVTAEAEGRIELAGWLGEGEGLWFIQGLNERRGVMRPFVWSARPQPRSTRAERLARYAGEWGGLLATPDDPGWDRLWTLITAVRAQGDAGALDQVQALEEVPAAAVALLLNARRAERAAALALEAEAPLWWPLVPVADWAQGLAAAQSRLLARLKAAGIAGAAEAAAQAMARAAGEILALRPELAAHLGAALAAAGLRPEARDAAGGASPLLPPPAAAGLLLTEAAQQAARRFTGLPQGVAGLAAGALRAPVVGDAAMAPLLHAPLVAAEVAAGRRRLAPREILQLIALRAADPAFFDAALPCALTLALDAPDR